MKRRERENPCEVCGHYHNYEAGEECGVCGHRKAAQTDAPPPDNGGAFPTEILKDFIYIGTYDHASSIEFLKLLGIYRLLNTVPTSRSLYQTNFTYHCLQDDKCLQFDEAIQFLEQCEKDKARVLVYCMSGRSRSPAIVIAYLMKCKGWRLAQSLHWVIECRPQVNLTEVVYKQLLEFEQRTFGSKEPLPVQTFPSVDSLPSFGCGFPKTTDAAPVAFSNQSSTISIFQSLGTDAVPSNCLWSEEDGGSDHGMKTLLLAPNKN